MNEPTCQELSLPWVIEDPKIVEPFCHQGWIYVAQLYELQNRLQILAYEPKRQVWHGLFDGLLEKETCQDRNRTEKIKLRWDQGPEGILTLSVQTPGGCWFLKQISVQADAPLVIEGDLGHTESAIALDPEIQSALAQFEPKPGCRLSHWLKVGTSLYIAIDDDEYGFTLWRTDLDPEPRRWTALIERGAERFIQNRQVFALVSYNCWLVIAAGTVPESRRPESAFFDYRGFELLRLTPESSEWDLLCGVPRVSPQGLKLPLSALGPSLGKRGREWHLLSSQGGRLWVGTQDEEGFKLWHSLEGEDWQLLSDTAFALIYQIREAQMLRIAERQALLFIDSLEPNGQPLARFWLLELGG